MKRSETASRAERFIAFIDRTLSTTVSVWLVLAIVLFFGLGTVAFGWYVKRSVFLHDESWLARAAIGVASLPTYVKWAFVETGRRLSEATDLRYVRATSPNDRSPDFTIIESEVDGTRGTLIVQRGPGTPALGWRIIVGAFKIGRSIEDAAILVSPELKIAHYWLLGERGPINVDAEPPSWNLTHGFSALRDGSAIHVFRDGTSLNRTDRCGRTMWSVPGDYHHSVTLDDSAETVWTLRDDPQGDYAERMKVVQVAVGDGKILREFSIADVISANPENDILELRRRHADDAEGNARALAGRWFNDPIHLNDVDPLPRTLAASFPQFSPGDLLISAREINLLFVLDPITLSIKWWRVGATIRQHDPDWRANGRLSVFNNRTNRGYSEIVDLDPRTGEKEVVVDGRDSDFYSRIRGNHQVLPTGGWLIASTQQGRVIEISPEGSSALVFQAPLNDERSTFGFLTDAAFLPEGSIDRSAFHCQDH
jgi:Arylsulfotransferase (ASST)